MLIANIPHEVLFVFDQTMEGLQLCNLYTREKKTKKKKRIVCSTYPAFSSCVLSCNGRFAPHMKAKKMQSERATVGSRAAEMSTHHHCRPRLHDSTPPNTPLLKCSHFS